MIAIAKTVKSLLSRSRLVIALAVVAVLAVGVEEWRIARLRADVADARTETAECRRENSALRAEISEQNARIRELQAEANAAALRAERAAQDALRRGRQERREIIADPSAGPEPLNAWLQETF